MALPAIIPCKVSSESAGYVTVSAVTRVDVPLDQLAAKILGICGKDPARISSILFRGALVQGDARYRWQSLQASDDELAALLDRFPDHNPDQDFDGSRCARMEFQGGRGEFEITREVGQQRRLFRRKAFWEEALALIQTLSPRCERYSYSDEADVFVADLTAEARESFRRLGPLLRFTSLEAQLRSLPAGRVSLFVRRSATLRE